MILRALTAVAAVAIGFASAGEALAQYYPPPPGAYGGAYTPGPYSGSYLRRREPAPLPPEDDDVADSAAMPDGPPTSDARSQYVDPRVRGAIQSEPLPDPRYGAAPSQAAPPYPATPATGAYPPPSSTYPPASTAYGNPPASDPAAPPAAGPRSWEEQQALRPPVDINPPPAGATPRVASAPPANAGAPAGTPATVASLPPEDQPETDSPKELPPNLRRQLVDYQTREPAGTIVIDTAHTYLYLVLGRGKALRYGIGVGREGFTWSGTERISRMAEWPDWHPPKEMIERQPYLPRFMAGGPGNPLGARALYLGKTLYRIHGTNQPSTIGSYVSSGCIRLLNEDVEDLYNRVQVGTRVVVLPGHPPASASNAAPAAAAAAVPMATTR